MNSKGLTLIELMIVLAIFGIVIPFMGFKEISDQYKFQEEIMLDQSNVMLFKKKLNTLLKDTKKFINVRNRQIVADNFTLKVAKSSRSKLSLNGKVYKFKKFEFGSFYRIDNNVVSCNVKNHNFDFDLFLVAGKAEIKNSNSNEDMVPLASYTEPLDNGNLHFMPNLKNNMDLLDKKYDEKNEDNEL